MSDKRLQAAVSPLPLLIGFLAGPILWSLHLLVSQILISSACASGGAPFVSSHIGALAGWQVILMLVTLVFVVLIVSVDGLALRSWRLSNAQASLTGDEGGAPGRSGWLALAGILLSTMFLIGIVMAGVPLLWLSSCG